MRSSRLRRAFFFRRPTAGPTTDRCCCQAGASKRDRRGRLLAVTIPTARLSWRRHSRIMCAAPRPWAGAEHDLARAGDIISYEWRSHPNPRHDDAASRDCRSGHVYPCGRLLAPRLIGSPPPPPSWPPKQPANEMTRRSAAGGARARGGGGPYGGGAHEQTLHATHARNSARAHVTGRVCRCVRG